MKNLITPEQVKARATSPENALEVSIEAWAQKCEMNEEEMKDVSISNRVCGLCHYYGIDGHSKCSRNNKGSCMLHSDEGCCPEWNNADDALREWNRNEISFAALKSAFYAMLDRLEREKAKLPKKQVKPEIRHTEYGLDRAGDPRIALETYDGKITYAGNACLMNPDVENEFPIVTRIGNLFDELSGMDGSMKEYEIFARSGGQVYARIDLGTGKDIYFPALNASLSLEQARRFARAILVLCANAERDK
jgi:hypothetical protein